MNILTSAPAWDQPGELKKIETQEDLDRTLELAKASKSFQKMVSEFFAPLKKKAHEAHRALTTKEGETLKPAKTFEAEAKRLMVAYYAQQEKERKEEERRLREEAAKREEEARLAEALHLEKMGAPKEEIESVMTLPDTPNHPPIAPNKTKIGGGASIRSNWKYRVVNPLEMSRKYMIPDHKKIKALVSGLGKEAAAVVGGIEVYEDTNISIRA